MNEIAKIAKEVLEQSALLQIKGVNAGAGLDILAYKIAEHIEANFKLERKAAWYGIDIEQKIKDLKQQLAIAYSYKNKSKPRETSDLYYQEEIC